ncbi:trypsin-related protease [Microdochium bolleyi]|uniref:Trypsin-related protease n=1 Tax=Microdochium bolleyi TaxID=196109 RepID=A0A136IL13_9PEZI|nr:trypsin-related protease [Microdochium bolleyi]
MSPNFKLAAILAILPALAAAAPTPSGARRQTEGGGFSSVQIVNGTTAAAGEFPYIVSVIEGGRHNCGGVLLDARTILTAAHCSSNANLTAYGVRAGSLDRESGGTVVGVSKVVSHPDWNRTLIDSDISVWHLDAPIEASSTIGYAVLPFQGSDPEDGTLTTVAGWGRIAEGAALANELQQVSVPVVDRATCAAAYLKNPQLPKIIDSMFCAGLPEGGQDSCNGDSGGPIIDAASGVLIGLVSWGFGCARPEFYGVYTRVGLFVDWINENRV